MNEWTYYNENAEYPKRWLRNLARAGQIPKGLIDGRSIKEVRGKDLESFKQCHFFAGIGGWPLALRLAGWPEDREVWTGSCPCQPFSVAGKGEGVEDERHLWPIWLLLIEECRPPTIFGEQVASKDGREWLSGVRADLEALGYVVGAADLCAASVGAPHIRQRLWWVASRMGQSNSARRNARQQTSKTVGQGCATLATSCSCRDHSASSCSQMATMDQQAGFWSDFDIVQCADGKSRRIEPGTFPLAHGVPARVGKLRAYGNAIVPQVAAVFIRACAEALTEQAAAVSQVGRRRVRRVQK